MLKMIYERKNQIEVIKHEVHEGLHEGLRKGLNKGMQMIKVLLVLFHPLDEQH
jgi:hypothetical protein